MTLKSQRRSIDDRISYFFPDIWLFCRVCRSLFELFSFPYEETNKMQYDTSKEKQPTFRDTTRNSHERFGNVTEQMNTNPPKEETTYHFANQASYESQKRASFTAYEYTHHDASKARAQTETTDRRSYRPYTKFDLEQDLSRFIGLDSVKERIRTIYAEVQLKRERIRRGLVTEDDVIDLHMAFTGSPGTGKTSVAKLIGEIFCKIGVLPQGQFVFVTKSDLKGQYIGESEAKLREILKRAMGGVLFIDEAYSLYDSEHPGASVYGRDIIADLIVAMEENRGKLCVILAGYTNEMNELFKANEGLRSRIQYVIEFPDYTAAELYEIFLHMAAEKRLYLDTEAKEYLCDLFTRKEKEFLRLGNARFARNVLQYALARQARRVEPNSSFAPLSSQFVLDCIG